MDHLQQWMEQFNMIPSIQQCILHTLWFHRAHSFSMHTNPFCLHATRDQDHIGLFGLMVGHLAQAWTPIQEQHYLSTNFQHSMALWAVCLCCQIIQMSHTLWLDCSHHVLVQRQLTASTVAYLAIEAQFCLGLQHLLPKDHFCITPGPHGFSLDQVLALNHEDQQLWLQSVQHTSKDATYFNLHLSMHQLMTDWLQPPNSHKDSW